jgi:hypothetical protein
MKRIITAMLTLALFTGLSAEKASAQISMRNTAEGGLNEISGIVVRFAASKTSRPNSVIPVAGVDRSVPLAGTNSKGSIKNPGVWQDCNNYDGVTPCAGSGHGDMPFSYNGDPPFGVSAGDDDLNVVIIVIDDMPFLGLENQNGPIFSFTHHANIDKIW